MIFRSWRNCIVWLIFSAIALGLALRFHPSGLELASTLWLLTLYGLQGLAAEIVGVKADETGLSFPRRPIPDFGLLAFWRTKIPARDIGRVDSWGRSVIRVYRRSAGALDIPLADQASRRRFMQFARQAYPWVDVF